MSTPAEIGWWKLDDDAANTDILDASGNGYHGTLAGGDNTEDISVAGQVGTALSFDGTAYVDFGSDSALTDDLATGLSIACWLYYSGGSGLETILGCTGATANNGYYLAVHENDLRLHIADGSNYFTRAKTANELASETWIHVAATYDGTTPRLYVNSVEQSYEFQDSGSGSYTSGDTLTLGARDSGLANLLTGSVDDLRLYGAALTPRQIKVLYNGGSGTGEALQDLFTPIGSIVAK
jgi:hypothetical protein